MSPLGLIDLPSPTHHHNRKSAFAIFFDNRYQTCQLLVIFADGDEAPAMPMKMKTSPAEVDERTSETMHIHSMRSSFDKNQSMLSIRENLN